MTDDDPNIIHQAERFAAITCNARERIIRRLVAELVKARRERDEAWEPKTLYQRMKEHHDRNRTGETR